MRRRCPGATALGTARLAGWRYVIAAGYGSVARASGRSVFGVLWRLTPRDLAALNIFESLDSGLYRRGMLTVQAGRRAQTRAGLCRAGSAACAARCRATRNASLRPQARGTCRRAISRNCAASRRPIVARARPRPENSRDQRHPSRGHSRPRPGRRLSGLRAGHGAAPRASKAGSGTGAMGLWRQCFPARRNRSLTIIAACRRGPRGARVDAVDVAEGGADLLDLRAATASAFPYCRRCEMKIVRSLAAVSGRSAARPGRQSRKTAAAASDLPPAVGRRCTAMATATRPAPNGPTVAAPAPAGSGREACSNIGPTCQPAAISCVRRTEPAK